MGRSWLFVLLMLAASLVTTASVHAREWQSTITLECTGAVHSDGDAQQPVGDKDPGIPHQHGTCHGQVVAMPSDDPAALTKRAAGAPPRPADPAALLAHRTGPRLRPPAA